MGRSEQEVGEIVSGTAPITPRVARELEQATRVPSGFWRAREDAYREFLAT